ncbi:MAG: acyltransferase family protein [Polyangiaceae bacterium]|jgi:1-acyl-sn-glycerol-3-phosphate acyltransferase|nr:acyltransferase family protein [Polyangiaceae bacterium]
MTTPPRTPLPPPPSSRAPLSSPPSAHTPSSPPSARPPLPPPSTRAPAAAASDDFAIERPGGEEGTLADAARELLSSDYYLRQWGRLGMRSRSEHVDEFGFDPKYEARYQPVVDFLYSTYFRVEAEGVGHVPDEGGAVLVANRAGPLPLDGLMLRTCVRRTHPRERALRWLVEDYVAHLPFAGALLTRLGAVRACQENAERLVRRGELIAVFPEGVKGASKLYRDRYKLQRFGRGGFVRLCLRTGTPLIPCAIVGVEEANPLLYRVDGPAKALGLPFLPITPTFPALGPLGLLPAPAKWRIHFGAPVDLGEGGPERANDELFVRRVADEVRATIQAMLDRALTERGGVFRG